MYTVLENETDFDELAKKGPLVVQFSASWCRPCQRLSPTLKTYCLSNNINAVYVDVDELNELADSYDVQKLPSVLIVKNAVVREKIEGDNWDVIEQKIKEHLL